MSGAVSARLWFAVCQGLRGCAGRCAVAALRRAEEEILRDHVASCVDQAIRSGNRADQRRKIAELMDAVGRAER